MIDFNFNEHVSDLGASYIGKQLKENTTLSSLACLPVVSQLKELRT